MPTGETIVNGNRLIPLPFALCSRLLAGPAEEPCLIGVVEHDAAAHAIHQLVFLSLFNRLLASPTFPGERHSDIERFLFLLLEQRGVRGKDSDRSGIAEAVS